MKKSIGILAVFAVFSGFAEYAVALGLGFCVIPVVEIVKFVQRKLAAKKGK